MHTVIGTVRTWGKAFSQNTGLKTYIGLGPMLSWIIGSAEG